MHRTLKAALKCSPETPWTQALPAVLLGLRTTFKEDLQASPAELALGTSLRIPGEFIAPHGASSCSPADFVSKLRRLFSSIRPVPVSRHSNLNPFVFQDLRTCEYVFRRIDAVKKPLEPPYTGPHRVVKRIDNRTFVVDINGFSKTLSTDQLKPAYLAPADEPHPQQVATPSSQTPEPQSMRLASTPQQSSPPQNLLDQFSVPRHLPNIIAPKKRVTFSLPSSSCPSQAAKSIGEGVAVAPPILPQATLDRSRRKQVLQPRPDVSSTSRLSHDQPNDQAVNCQSALIADSAPTPTEAKPRRHPSPPVPFRQL